MVAPALIAAGSAIASKAPAVLGAIKNFGSNIGNFLSSNGAGILNIGNSLGNFGGGLIGGNDNVAAAKAYQDYLNGISSDMKNQLEARAEKYDTKLQNQFNEAEPQYLQEAYSQLPELQNLIDDINTQNTETQRANRRQINANLAQQGVRGGQAAIIANRALGETTRNTQRDINNLVYNEALNRQNSRLNYFGDKSLTPWKTMSNAYGDSMVGANNALSGAQGNVYANAYNRAMANYGNTQKKSGLFG